MREQALVIGMLRTSPLSGSVPVTSYDVLELVPPMRLTSRPNALTKSS
jgi:hypothetical protein